MKVTSGDSLHDYLQTKLWFGKGAATILDAVPGDSAKHTALQFADVLAGCIQDRFEKSESAPFDRVRAELDVKMLFFPSHQITQRDSAELVILGIGLRTT